MSFQFSCFVERVILMYRIILITFFSFLLFGFNSPSYCLNASTNASQNPTPKKVQKPSKKKKKKKKKTIKKVSKIDMQYAELKSLEQSIDSLKLIMNLPINPPSKTNSGVKKANTKTIIGTELEEKQNLDFIKILLSLNDDSLKPIIDNPKKYKLQIIYTQINRDKSNKPSLKEYRYLVDAKNYFYPASMVKLPVSALALQKLNETNLPGLNMNTTMLTDALPGTCQTTVFKDTTSENKKPSIAHYIKKMLLVSDNDAYSRVYEYLGRDYIHEKLNLMGLPKIRIVHRFDPNCIGNENACTNPIFFPVNNDTMYKQEAFCSTIKLFHPTGNALIGKAYMTNSGKKILKPKNFIQMNYCSLQDIDAVLKRVIFPNIYSSADKFNLTENDYKFLKKYLGMIPRESDYPHYPDSIYEDSYKKYFMYGNVHGKMQNDSVRIFNIVGQSYGFLGDCAYIVDKKKGIEFFLSAVIYVNEDEIINDGIYEYKKIGFPFLAHLGTTFYNFEASRKKDFIPNFDDLDIK